MSNEVAIADVVYSVRPAFESVLSDRAISFEREAEFALQILESSDYLMKIARGNPQSLRNAITNTAAIGISLNPALKQAYLVPRKGAVCLDISYQGLMDLAINSGSVRWGQARLVYESDTFEVNGIDREPVHRFSPFARDRGAVIGVYCVVKTADGDYLTDAMSTDEINAIRDRSEAWKAWIEKQKKCPWVTDWGEMAKKTVVKRASKYWPTSERLAKAIHHLNTDGGEGLHDAGKPADDCPEELLQAAREAAMNGLDAYAEFFKATGPANRKLLATHHAGLKSAAQQADAARTVEEGQ